LQAAIVDEYALHFVDMQVGKETLQIASQGIAALAYSPADSYLIICEKYNISKPGGHQNLQILNA
jgi:hypothetical protein